MKPEKMSEDLMGRMRFLSEMGNSRVGQCLEHIEAMEAEATALRERAERLEAGLRNAKAVLEAYVIVRGPAYANEEMRCSDCAAHTFDVRNYHKLTHNEGCMWQRAVDTLTALDAPKATD